METGSPSDSCTVECKGGGARGKQRIVCFFSLFSKGHYELIYCQRNKKASREIVKEAFQ